MYVFLSIIIVYCVMYVIVPRKYIGWLFVAFVAAMSIMAYFTLPSDGDDLNGYFELLEEMRDIGLGKFLREMNEPGSFFSGMPTCGLYFYFVSKLQYNGFLPAITIFICYGGMFLVLYKAANRFEVGKWYLFIGSLLLLITYSFHGLVSGIRNGLAATVFCVCTYFEYVDEKNKPLCWIGYILCLGLHASGIIFFAARVINFANDKKDRFWLTVSMAAMIALSSPILAFLGEHTNIAYFKTMAFKEESYSQGGFQFGIAGFFAKIIRFAVLMFYTVYGLKYIKETERYDEQRRFITFSLCLMMYTLFVIYHEIYFSRAVGWGVPFVGSMLTMIGLNAQRKIIEKQHEKKHENSIIRERTVLTSNELILNLVLIAAILLLGWVVFFNSSLLYYYVGRS